MDPNLAAEKLAQLSQRSTAQRKRFYARQPKHAKNIVAQLLARKGYGANQANEKLQNAWNQAVGDALARFSRATRISRGRLEVLVAHSMMMQELGFERDRLLSAMQQAIPDARIKEIRFRIGKVD